MAMGCWRAKAACRLLLDSNLGPAGENFCCVALLPLFFAEASCVFSARAGAAFLCVMFAGDCFGGDCGSTGIVLAMGRLSVVFTV